MLSYQYLGYKYSSTAEQIESEVIPMQFCVICGIVLLLTDSVVDNLTLLIVVILKYHYKMNFQ